MPKAKKARTGARRKAKRFFGRARAAGRRYAGRRRRGAHARMGLIGKTGTVLAGGVPIGLAAVDAAAPWLEAGYANLAVSDKLRHSIAGFTNNLTNGFGLGMALPGVIAGIAVPNTMAGAGGGYLKTTAAGVGLVVIDGVIGTIMRFAAGAKVRPKFMGRQLISG